jgi:hypothetical protein
VHDLLRIAAALIDNVVRRQLPRLIADAEALLNVAAWCDLPAGCRIIDIEGARLGGVDGGILGGVALGTGHRLADAHGFRHGAVAVGVAAECLLRRSLGTVDELTIAVGEAAALIEFVAAHELAHALVADRDIEASVEALRALPQVTGGFQSLGIRRRVRSHPPRWAAALVIVAERCMGYRPRARHRWRDHIDADLLAVGIDAEALTAAVGDVPADEPLRDLLADGSPLVRRVDAACPHDNERVQIIKERLLCLGTVSPLVAAAEPGDFRGVA